MYRAIKSFADMEDGQYIYSVGDTYPRDGKKANADRVKVLKSANNRLGTALIEEVKEKKTAKK